MLVRTVLVPKPKAARVDYALTEYTFFTLMGRLMYLRRLDHECRSDSVGRAKHHKRKQTPVISHCRPMPKSTAS